jgi:hypothetical protein
MSGAQFIQRIGGGGTVSAKALYQTAVNAVSGTYTLPSKRMLIVFTVEVEVNGGTGAMTISGHAATQVIQYGFAGGASDAAMIFATMVDPAVDPNTWSFNVVTNGGRIIVGIYFVDGPSSLNVLSSTTVLPTGTLNVKAGTTVIAAAIARGVPLGGLDYTTGIPIVDHSAFGQPMGYKMGHGDQTLDNAAYALGVSAPNANSYSCVAACFQS